MKVLIKRELTLLLSSSIAIIFLLGFIIVAWLMNWFFPGNFNILDNGYANLNRFFQLAPVLLMIIIPALTMRAFSEEKRNKNMDVFHSRPVGIISLYFSKLISSFIIVILAIIATWIYIYSINELSSPIGNIDFNEIIASYLSLILLSTVFLAIGLFASTLTNNQIVALLIGIFLNVFFFYGFELLASFFASGKIQLIISSFGLSAHNELMRKGVIQLSDILILFNYIFIFSILSVFLLNHKTSKTKKQFVIGVGVLVVLNILCFFIPDYRFDYTSDKRYTLSKYSEKLLKQISENNDHIHIEVYLDGDMNLSFQHLQDAIISMLFDIKYYSDNHVTFGVTNPYSSGANPQEIYSKMLKQNMKGIMLNEIDREGKTSQKVIYPYAQAIHNGDTLQINLLKNIAGYSAEENINASIENLEFEFIDAIRLFNKKESESIAFIEGHGELPRSYVYDAEELLSKYYFINRGEIGFDIGMLDDFKVIIIAGTTDKYSEREKFIIDQYIMSGGRVLWLIDGVYLSQEELEYNGQTPSIKNDVGLDDMLFTYGIRINPVLLQDMQCTSVILTSDGNNYTTHPWYYSALLLPSLDHPITKDISLVKGMYGSSIDIVDKSNALEKSVLLTTSSETHVIQVPEMINFDQSKIQLDKNYFDQSFLPVSVALKGNFNSSFTDRIIPDSVVMHDRSFKSNSIPTKMVVASCSDIIKNDWFERESQMQILPMGYDRVSDKQYGNRDFIVNAVNWLANDDDWLSLRSKEQKIRLLNKQLVYSERNFYVILNIVFPLFFVLTIVGGFNIYRKYKYEK